MQRFELKRHVSRRLASARRLGAADPGAELSLSVLLHPKDGRALAEAVRDASDPSLPGYGRYFSAEELRRLVSPGWQDIDAVVAWLNDAGLSTEEPAGARTVIRAHGPVEKIARALEAPFGAYAVDGGTRGARGAHATRLAIEEEPRIPAALAPLVRGIAGLNTFPPARIFPPPIAKPIRFRGGRVPPERGPAGGYSPVAIREAYEIPQEATGADERVAILEFGGGFSLDDFTHFCREFGLPETAAGEVSVRGAKNDFRGRTGDADVEVALDMDWVRATAPEAHVELWWAPNTDTGWVDFLARVLDAPEERRPTVVSISWGMTEDGFSTSRRYDQTRQLFQACALAGVTFVCASGDAGASDEMLGTPGFDGQRHVDFPSIVPEVTAVGGTKLVEGARGYTESVWNDGAKGGASGGGFSRFIRVPEWQRDSVGKRASMRGVPDVAAVASPDPGLAIRVRKQWTAAGGTSVAAPIWAGVLALVNQARRQAGRPRLGAANPALYALPSSVFHDVLKGDNGYGGVTGFAAGKGWDAVTGLGSPRVERLIEKL